MNQYINISVCRSTHQVLYELRSVPPDRFDRLEDVDLSVLDDLLDTRVRGAVHTAPGQYKIYCVQYTPHLDSTKVIVYSTLQHRQDLYSTKGYCVDRGSKLQSPWRRDKFWNVKGERWFVIMIKTCRTVGLEAVSGGWRGPSRHPLSVSGGGDATPWLFKGFRPPEPRTLRGTKLASKI